jgi:hypothetical protein
VRRVDENYLSHLEILRKQAAESAMISALNRNHSDACIAVIQLARAA